MKKIRKTRKPRKSSTNGNPAGSKQFLSLLFSRYVKHKRNTLLELRSIRKDVARSSFFRLDEIPEMISAAEKQNRDGYDVYFSVNPRPESRRKTKDDIKDLVCLWVDVDGKYFDNEKDGALKRIREFPLVPNIVVDSGNGYHAYWVLKNPIINRTAEKSLEANQILHGVINTIGADGRCCDFSRVMRFPGTNNYKEPNNPVVCTVVNLKSNRFYTLSDFCQYRDTNFNPDELNEVDINYSGNDIFIRDDNSINAIANAKELRVSPRIQEMIISGTHISESGKDSTRSGRDQAIITAMISKGYSVKSIEQVFCNRFLKCSNRIDGDLKKLHWDIKTALAYLKKNNESFSAVKNAITEVFSSRLSPREKIRKARTLIIRNLKSVGIGCVDKGRKAYFFFDNKKKQLINTNSEEFKHLLVNQYGLVGRELNDMIRGVQAEIHERGKEIEAYKFAYFNRKRNILYVSNYANQVYRLDGSNIKLVDNSTDGIFFENKPHYLPFHVDESKYNEVPNYFSQGFCWSRFTGSSSLLNQKVIQLANFSTEEPQGLTAENQKYLLIIYFFSLYFESMLTEKPILCFVGVKSSGKSFVATSIGKTLFGDNFLPSHLPDSVRDFKVALSENSYLVIDNVDSPIHPFMDALCAAATGAEISYRKLYTDNEEIRLRPRVFIVITSREPKFRRDDLVDRLMLLQTQVITRPKSRSSLFKEIADNRNMIMTELLVNLNSIVRLLKKRSNWDAPCTFRIADFELFGRKIHAKGEQQRFITILKRMNRQKSAFGLEEDPLYILLQHKIYNAKETIEKLSAGELYYTLSLLADSQKNREFTRRYKSSISLGRRIANIQEELKVEFNFEIHITRMRKKLYTVRAK